MLEFLTSYWEAIIAVSALSVSTVSSLIALRVFRLQREHNFRSLRPIFHIEPYDYENRIVVKIMNEGTGPAVVQSVEVVNHLGESRRTLFRWCPPELPGEMNYKEYWTREGGFVLRPGSKDHMLEIPVDTSLPEETVVREKIRAILADLTVIVTFRDVYDNKMPPYRRSLSLFSRTDHEN